MNILFIICHDLGRQLGCYGRGVKTPNLDTLAGQGARLDNAFCNTAVCSPSRGVCLTGLHAHNNGLMGLAHFGWRIAPGVRTAAEYFAEAGYDTVHCGLSHEGEENRSRYQTDFEVHWRSQTAEAAVDDAIAWLRARQKAGRKSPFYMNLGTIEAHPCVWRVDEDRPGFPSRLHRDYGGPVASEATVVPPPTPDIPLTRDEFGRFEAGIQFLDREVGRLLLELEKLGLADDTLIVFTTDHGMNDLRGKGTLYDRGLETALLFRGPGVRPSATYPHLIQNLDLLPTLLDAAGVPVPAHLPGRSFWPLLTGGPYEPHEGIFLEWNFGGPREDYSPIRAVRTRTHKYLRNFDPGLFDLLKPEEIPADFSRAQMQCPKTGMLGTPYRHPSRKRPPEELYDLRTDPHELHNLADDPAHGELLTRLSATVDRWMAQTDDHLLRGEIPLPREPAGWHF